MLKIGRHGARASSKSIKDKVPKRCCMYGTLVLESEVGRFLPACLRLNKQLNFKVSLQGNFRMLVTVDERDQKVYQQQLKFEVE